MTPGSPFTVLCIASYEKGQEFMRQCKRNGCRTLLLTSKSLENADWPRDHLDDIFFIPDRDKEWNMDDAIKGVSYLARTIQFDRIVPLDDFDVEKAAAFREHLRVPGMGDTTARYFRDKLAMRMRAKEAGIPVPRFCGIINYERLNQFLQSVPPPYVLKPRSSAGSIGIKKCENAQELWDWINALGDKQSFYLVEEFIAGNILHADTITDNRKLLFSITSRYGIPPMEVSHQGRVFSTQTLPTADADSKSVRELNKSVLKAFGMVRGVSHSEFIQGTDGTLYFLETSARVAGAHIAEMLEAATGFNLWAEWANLETATPDSPYLPPTPRKDFAGMLTCLANVEYPDLSSYDAPEVFWRMHRAHHAGIVLRSPKFDRITELMEHYTRRFYDEFFISLPPRETPTF